MIREESDDPEVRWAGKCDCGRLVEYLVWDSGDIDCECGRIYNAFGQRLRDDLYSRPNPSERDDNIDDMTGYEMAYGGDE